jgi:hypothetical protein
MCYRLWASIKELIDIDEGKTPVQDCTVEMRGQNKGLQQGSKSIISGFKLPLLGLLISLKWVFKVLKGFQDISSNLWFSWWACCCNCAICSNIPIWLWLLWSLYSRQNRFRGQSSHSDSWAACLHPHYIWQPPPIWTYQPQWDCPGCDYTTDFLNLQKEHLGLLPKDLAEYVSSMKWGSMVEDRIVQTFGIMARHHYLWHLHQVGVEMACRNGKVCYSNGLNLASIDFHIAAAGCPLWWHSNDGWLTTCILANVICIDPKHYSTKLSHPWALKP